MTNQRAKEILLLYRPGTADADEPEVAQALEAARRDPELGRWLEQQRVFHAAMRSGLRQWPVPEGLRGQILSEVQAEVRSRRRHRFVLGTAVLAAVAVLFGLAVLRPRPGSPVGFEAFRARMVKTALRGYKMDLATNDLSQIRRYLADHQAPGAATLPEGIESVAGRQAIRPTGCALLAWQNQPVSMLCFLDPNQRPLWLFVIDHSALPDGPSDAVPRFKQVNVLTTASWSSAGKTYLLAGEGEEASLKPYL